MEIKLTIDRIEEGRAILLDGEGKMFECEYLSDYAEGDILLCEIGNDGEITVKEKMKKETEEKKEEMSNRLKALFSRGDK